MYVDGNVQMNVDKKMEPIPVAVEDASSVIRARWNSLKRPYSPWSQRNFALESGRLQEYAASAANHKDKDKVGEDLGVYVLFVVWV